MTTELEKAIEDCLKSKIWAERTSALVVLNKVGNISSSKEGNEDYLRKEIELLKKVAEFARHANYCNAALSDKNNCNCGYEKAFTTWFNAEFDRIER